MAEKINVAIISFPIDQLGGAFDVYRNWLVSLDKSSFNVHFITCSEKYEEIEKKLEKVSNVTVKNINGLSKWRSIYIIGIFSLVKYLKENKIDILHTSMLQADIIGSFCGKVAGVNVIISTVVGRLINTSDGLKGKIKKYIYKTLYQIIQKWFSVIITISRATSEELIKEFKVDQKKIKINYCGIKLSRGRIAEGNHDNPHPIIGVIGELIPPKGIKIFIEAIPLISGDFPNVRFLVAGDGPQKKVLEEQVSNLNLIDKVSFLGWVDNPRKIINNMDIFVFPSLPNYEGLPRVILEAWSVGTPVVATKVACVPELFDNKNVGIVIEPNNSIAIYKAVKYLMNNPEKAKQMSKNAMSEIVKFDRDVEVKRLQWIYMSLAKKNTLQVS